MKNKNYSYSYSSSYPLIRVVDAGAAVLAGKRRHSSHMATCTYSSGKIPSYSPASFSIYRREKKGNVHL